VILDNHTGALQPVNGQRGCLPYLILQEGSSQQA